MSRIGKHPISVPAGVEVSLDHQLVVVKGKLGQLQERLPGEVEIALEDGSVTVRPRDPDEQRSRAMWGLARTLVANMVEGVTNGFTQKLEISGVGYRASVDGKILNLQLGFSHDIKVAVPSDIEVKAESPTVLTISGASKQRVGQLAAEIRGFRPPEPYKGKGVRYAGEHILRKEGKKK
jgi:large subunit ribosomal protein L6